MVTRRELLAIGGAFAATSVIRQTAFSQVPSASPSSSTEDPFALVNPEFRPMLKQIIKSMGTSPAMSSSTLAKQRETSNHSYYQPLPAPVITERMISGPTGAPKVRVFVVGDNPEGKKPAVLHIHGGGFVAGTAATEKRAIQDISSAHDCVVVSVDYRLAPETPFPGSLEDNYAALRWMNTNAKELGIDVARIAVKGESAGGGHAATLAIASRDRGEFPLCLQVLIYPMLDDRTGSSNPVPASLGHFFWTPESNRFGWTSLLGVPAGSERVPANSVPARVTNLKGLAPAFIGVGSIDLFAPEDIEYAKRLTEAGIATELHLVPGGFHGFDLFPIKGLIPQFKQAWNEALSRAFLKPVTIG